jgi:hypothetical protein
MYGGLRAHALNKWTPILVFGVHVKAHTHAGQTEVNQRSYAPVRVEEKIGRLDVAVDDAPRMNVPQRTKHASKVCLDSSHRKCAVKRLKD